ncbi:glycosyltransferase family 2 protein [Helicobacter didelphidarum]|uniref:Glycosyltransferase family 2 protein n=1 Tax=Helicobacter didelphidarum TaxID=2040648 RepID=A0A3D8IL40_9HELI|nr:glycosyltransferase family 2 protein [Helicobacter didelphidarum]RDU65344.1 glycosyltransferase family 2 protein [Helicobacter didelphidarum]
MSNKPNIKPLVSIIIPFYNVEKYLSQCLDSIINQTYKNLEIILINDGSSDKSGSIAKEYENLDKRIKVFEQKNMGAGATRNAGFVKSSGEYVLFFDSDDWLHSCDAIELLITRALQTHADIIIAQSRAYRDKDKNFEDMPHSLRMDLLPQKEAFNYTDFPKYIFNFCVGWAWDKLYKRDFIENHKIAFSEVASTNDLYFVFLSLFFANRISIVPQILFIKRIQLLHSIGATLYKNPLLFFEETMKLKKALLTGGGGGARPCSQKVYDFLLIFFVCFFSL